jgi:hypothetical protein
VSSNHRFSGGRRRGKKKRKRSPWDTMCLHYFFTLLISIINTFFNIINV